MSTIYPSLVVMDWFYHHFSPTRQSSSSQFEGTIEVARYQLGSIRQDVLSKTGTEGLLLFAFKSSRGQAGVTRRANETYRKGNETMLLNPSHSFLAFLFGCRRQSFFLVGSSPGIVVGARFMKQQLMQKQPIGKERKQESCFSSSKLPTKWFVFLSSKHSGSAQFLESQLYIP